MALPVTGWTLTVRVCYEMEFSREWIPLNKGQKKKPIE